MAGRDSDWEYYNSDHAFLAGKKAAKMVGAEAGVEIRNMQVDWIIN